MAGVALLVLLVGALSIFLVARSSGNLRGPLGVNPPTSTQPPNSLGSCVEPVSVENLAHLDFAFDGTIRDIAVPEDSERPTEVTFQVHRWYTRDRGSRVTVQTYERPGTVTSAGGPELAVGARLLASGDDVFLWGCGFTLPYTEANAELFDSAFANR
ncbi:MAG TPA: hypothetical protein VEQ37_12390 [Actinomycetota bacterium]|nr:hypothetical protein [Actinomycetota bacterium]